MEEGTALSRVAMHITGGCLVVPIQVELYNEVILKLQKDILDRVNETGVKGVIIDVSAVDIIDSFIAQTMSDTARMASLLGATTMVVGLKPGVASSLVDLDFELEDMQTAITVDEGFRRLRPVVFPEEKSDEIEETEEEPDEDQTSDVIEDVE